MTLAITSRRDVARHSVAVTLAGEALASVAFTPGQYITCHIPVGEHVVARSYSVARGPSAVDTSLEIIVKATKPGGGAAFLAHEAPLGTTLPADAPAGSFTLRDDPGPVAFAGAGSGVVPLLALCEHAVVLGRQVHVLQADADAESAIESTRFSQLCTRAGPASQFTAHLGQPPSRENIVTWLISGGAQSLYVCGPGGFIDLVAAAANTVSALCGRVYRESFSVPPGPTP